jgi:proline dehydrogenase
MNLFDRLMRWTLPLVPRFIVRRVARRYVAGETLDDAVRVVRRLNDEGAMATLDVLGEDVTEAGRARAAVDEYRRVLDAIAEQGLDCNISVKPSLVGLRVSEDLCRDAIEQIARHAAGLENFVRLDMEDHSATDATLSIYRQLQPVVGNLGVVLQSMLRRTLADAGELLSTGANVRLVKGIYREPRRLAWRDFDIVRENFVYALEKLLRGGSYVGIATHDEYLVWAGQMLADRLGLDRGQYEFQMLLGVRDGLRRTIIDQGHRLRVYVPFGRDWHPYSVRRLRENPTVAWYVLRAMLPSSREE